MPESLELWKMGVRYGWLSAGPLTGRDALDSDIPLKAGAGRMLTGGFGVSNDNKQTFVLGHCRW
jgi:hypothetical protein